MTTPVYQPADGVVALDDDQLAALVALGQGRPVPPALRSWLARVGILRAADPAGPVHPADPRDPTQAMHAADPAAATYAVAHADGAEPEGPGKPGDPADTAARAGSTVPRGPGDPGATDSAGGGGSAGGAGWAGPLDMLDPPMRPVVAALCGPGPRLRLQSRAAGRLTYNDAFLPLGEIGLGRLAGGLDALPTVPTATTGAVSPADPTNPTNPTGPAGTGPAGFGNLSAKGAATALGSAPGATRGGGAAGRPAGRDLPGWRSDQLAALVVRLPGTGVAYLRGLPVGALARHLARRMGLGMHLLATASTRRTVTLPDWATVRDAFETPAPSGWAGHCRQAELHELRWARGPGWPAATALALVQLDGTLAEVRPTTGDGGPEGAGGSGGAYVVQPAEPRSVWLRLCRLLSSPPAPPAPAVPGGPAR